MAYFPEHSGANTLWRDGSVSAFDVLLKENSLPLVDQPVFSGLASGGVANQFFHNVKKGACSSRTFCMVTYGR